MKMFAQTNVRKPHRGFHQFASALVRQGFDAADAYHMACAIVFGKQSVPFRPALP